LQKSSQEASLRNLWQYPSNSSANNRNLRGMFPSLIQSFIGTIGQNNLKYLEEEKIILEKLCIKSQRAKI